MRARPARDQGETPFSPILERLRRAVGAVATALVDQEGETVDYAGHLDPFETRILAAELRLLSQQLAFHPHLAASYEITIRAKKKSFVVRTLPEGYALAIELARRSSQISGRPLSVAVRELCAEAGFEAPSQWLRTLRQGARRQWLPVHVREETGRSHRPSAIDSGEGAMPVEVLGRVPAEAHEPKARGFRVRLETGQEGTLVRERGGHWYLEEDSWF